MSVDVASLVIEIDSTQAIKAAGDLDKLTAAGERAQGSAGRVRTATEQAGIGIKAGGDAAAGATKKATDYATATGAVGKAVKASSDASAVAVRSATDLANSQGVLVSATRDSGSALVAHKAAVDAGATAMKEGVRQTAATTAELGVYQAKMVAATMAQAGMTQSQAEVLLGFRDAAAAEKTAAQSAADLRASRALDAASMRELVKAGKDFDRDTVASAEAAAKAEIAAASERTAAIMADRQLEAAAQRELVAAAKEYDRDVAAAQVAADRETAASAKAEAKAQAAADAEVVTAQRARTAEIMEARALEAASQRELVAAGKKYDAAQVASARTAELLAGKVDKIRSALDPMAAAQLKAAANMATLDAAFAKGVISQAEYATMTKAVGTVSEAASAVEVAAHGRVVGSSLKVRESLVLMREASRGDLTRMAGSATILAGAFNLMTGSILAAAAPFIVIAAAVGLVAFAMLKGQAEISKFNGSLIATGNYAGLTSSSLDSMSKRIAASSDTTIGSVRKIAEEFAASGKFSAQAIAAVTDVVANYSRITGESAEKIAKQYDGMKDHLIQWAVKHEDVYHDLTVQQLDHVANLIKEGREAEAQAALLKDIDDESKRRLAEKTADELKQMGFLEEAMHGMIILASKFWDALLGIGRGQTLDQKISDQTGKVLAAQDAIQGAYTKGTTNGRTPLTPAQIANMKAALGQETAQLQTLQAQKSAEDKKAADEAAAAAARHDAIQKKYGDGKTHASTKADPVAERLQALAAEADGNRLLATSTDLTTVAGVKALAMQKALADAAKTSRAGTDLSTQAQKFYAAELAVVVTATAKQAEEEAAATNAKSAATEQATALVEKLGVSQAVANKMAADSTEIGKLQAAYNAASLRDQPMLAKAIADKTAAQERDNKAAADAFLVNSHQSATDQLEQMKLEASLIGATNLARAVAIAQLKEEQTLKLNHVAPTLADGSANPAYAKAVNDAENVAAAGAAAANATDRHNSALTEQLHLFQDLQSATQAYGQGLTDVFGKAGTAIANVTDVFLGHAAALADITAQQKAVKDSGGDPIKEAELSRKAADLQVQAYADVLGAAASAFGKQTAAYKILHGAEEAYRIFQFAMAVKSILFKTAETGAIVANAGASVAADATTTTSTLVTSALKATAHGIVAIARAMADLPFPLNLIAGAATAAALVGFGVKVFGGGGGGGSIPTSDATQKAQGAGTVLGDSAAKSASIAHSLDIVAKNTNTDLQYSNQMLRSLQSIDQNIGALTSQLAKQLGVGAGAFNTSGLGLGSASKLTGTALFGHILGNTPILGGLLDGVAKLVSKIPVVGGLLTSLFGTKTTKTLTDQGLAFKPQTLGSVDTSGLDGQTFQDIETKKKSKFFGVSTGTKTSDKEITGALDSGVQDQLRLVVLSLRDGVLTAAGALGVAGAQAALDAFTIDIGKISFKDMTGDEIQSALQAVFSKLGDQMAADVLPVVTAFQKAGEGAFETLIRLANDYQTVDVTLQAMGKSFGAVGLSSIAAREGLVNLFGSLQDFVDASAFFTQNFLSEAEQIAPIQAAVQKEFARLGVSGVNSVADFKQLVLGLDLTTDAGQQMYASLLAVAPAFKKVFDYLNPDAANAAADGWRSVFQSLTDWIHELNGEITASAQSTAQAYAALQAAGLAARGGDLAAAGKIVDLGNAYLTAAKASASSELDYLLAVAKARAIASSVQLTAANQAGMATGAAASTAFSPATSATGATAPTYKPPFATGGSFTIGGTGSGDSQDFGSWRGSPGEVVNISRKDNMEAVAAALREVKTALDGLKEDNRAGFTKLASTLGRVAKQLEDWDGAGLPPDRTAEEAA